MTGAPLSSDGQGVARRRSTLSKMWVLRRILMPMGVVDAMEFLVDKLKQTKNNHDFYGSMNQ